MPHHCEMHEPWKAWPHGSGISSSLSSYSHWHTQHLQAVVVIRVEGQSKQVGGPALIDRSALPLGSRASHLSSLSALWFLLYTWRGSFASVSAAKPLLTVPTTSLTRCSA